MLRFTRVVFGVKSSPFLLNTTIHQHMQKYREVDLSFVDTFLSSIYVDDVSIGSADVDSTYELYLKSKLRLSEVGFWLRKFTTNSEELRHKIEINERLTDETSEVGSVKINEDDQLYAKESLGIMSKSSDAQEEFKILGVQWNFVEDTFVFDVSNVARLMNTAEATKRNVVSMATRFYDPLGVVSPVTILFKMLFQRLCEAKLEWDDPLSGDLLSEWNGLISALQGTSLIVVPRCYFKEVDGPLVSARLIGFCDASTRAYAAVVYLRLQVENGVHVRFLAAKTWIS